MFIHPDNYGRTSQKSALKLFQKKSDSIRYYVSISNSMQFQPTVSYITRGTSCHQIRGILKDIKRIRSNQDY